MKMLNQQVSNVSFKMPDFIKSDLRSFQLLAQLSDSDYANVIIGLFTYTGKARAIKLYPKSIILKDPYVNKCILHTK